MMVTVVEETNAVTPEGTVSATEKVSSPSNMLSSVMGTIIHISPPVELALKVSVVGGTEV